MAELDILPKSLDDLQARQIGALNRRQLRQGKESVRSGGEDTVTARGFTRPSSNTENAIVVKAPSAAWGTGAYGTGQAFMYLRSDYTGGPAESEPDRNVLFRVDKWGGIGTAGGIHVATNYRTPDRSPAPTYGISIDNAIGAHDCVGLVVTSASAAPTKDWILCQNTSSVAVFRVHPQGWGTFSSINTSTFGALSVGIGGEANATLAVGAAANDIITGSAQRDAVVRAQSPARRLYFGAGLTDLWMATNFGGVSGGGAALTFSGLNPAVSYALWQGTTGNTIINAASGGEVYLGVNNVQYVRMSPFRTKFYNGIEMTDIGSDAGTPPAGTCYFYLFNNALKARFPNGVIRTIATN